MADAFDKLKSSWNRGSTTINVKTSSSLERAKLKTHIESLKNEIRKLYFEAGEMAYNKWINGDPDCANLERLFEDIKGKQKTISDLSAELNAIHDRDSQILGTEVEKPPAANVVCPSCGAGYENPVKFCRNCGFRMQD